VQGDGAAELKVVHAGELGHHLAHAGVHVHKGVGTRDLGQLHGSGQGHIALARMHPQGTGAHAHRQRAGGAFGQFHGQARPATQLHTTVDHLGRQQVHRRVAEGARHADRLGHVKDLGGRAVLQQFARVHHRRVAAQQQRLAGLGGGVDHGGVAGREQLGQFLAQLFAQLVVQVHQRLVQQHQRGVLGQGAGQRHALLLATGELGRQAVQKDVDVQALGELPHLSIDRGARQTAQFQR
jgi:hypothetical protein